MTRLYSLNALIAKLTKPAPPKKSYAETKRK
jgi:hypothetical protein